MIMTAGKRLAIRVFFFKIPDFTNSFGNTSVKACSFVRNSSGCQRLDSNPGSPELRVFPSRIRRGDRTSDIGHRKSDERENIHLFGMQTLLSTVV